MPLIQWIFQNLSGAVTLALQRNRLSGAVAGDVLQLEMIGKVLEIQRPAHKLWPELRRGMPLSNQGIASMIGLVMSNRNANRTMVLAATRIGGETIDVSRPGNESFLAYVDYKDVALAWRIETNQEVDKPPFFQKLALFIA